MGSGQESVATLLFVRDAGKAGTHCTAHISSNKVLVPMVDIGFRSVQFQSAGTREDNLAL